MYLLRGTRKRAWGEGGNEGIYDSQRSRLIHFLITGKYIGIACRGVKFKAKTNGKQCLLRTQYMEGSVWINSTFFLDSASYNIACAWLGFSSKFMLKCRTFCMCICRINIIISVFSFCQLDYYVHRPFLRFFFYFNSLGVPVFFMQQEYSFPCRG